MPKYSIVIPTRNRAETLKWTLRTCVEVDHEDFEIVVSDNASTDDTRLVVDAVGDSRIRYVRTADYVAMGLNFEFALKQALGEFLIFIGDDDGIVPFALRALDLAFERDKTVDYINWHHNGFAWPGSPQAKLAQRWLGDLGQIERETPSQTWRRISSPRSTDANELNGYNLYHACVRRAVVDRATAAGVSVFRSTCPDVASGIRVLAFAGDKLRLPVALTCIGLSSRSNSATNSAVRLAAQPTDDQVLAQTEFGRMNAAAFPDAAFAGIAAGRTHRALAFLSPLVDEHLARYGHLRGLDTDRWRLIFADSLAGTPADRIEGFVSDFNQIARWMQDHGADGNKTLASEDVKALSTGPDRLQKFYQKAFRFSDATVAAARLRGSTATLDDAEGRIVSIHQDQTHIWVAGKGANGDFSIHDHVKIFTALTQGTHPDTVRLLIEDPTLLQSRILEGILGMLAA